jgi:hypothetical protein
MMILIYLIPGIAAVSFSIYSVIKSKEFHRGSKENNKLRKENGVLQPGITNPETIPIFIRTWLRRFLERGQKYRNLNI